MSAHCVYTFKQGYRPDDDASVETDVVYGPDYYKVAGVEITNIKVRIGEATRRVLKLVPMTPERESEKREFPDEPEVPSNLRLVFWVRDPRYQPNLSRACSRVSIQEVLRNKNKEKYIPLLERATFLLDN